MWRKVWSIGALKHSVAGRNARSLPSCQRQPLPLPLPLPRPRGCSSSSASGRVRGKMEFCSSSSKKTTFNHIPPLRPPPPAARSFFIISCCRFSSSTTVIDSKGDGGGDGLPVASSNSNNNNKNKIKHNTTTAKAAAEATKHEGSSKDKETMTCEEAKRLMRLVNVEALKMKLGMEGKEVIPYSDLLDACKSMGLARSSDEAVAFARILDEAGVVLLFRDKVYLHPDKVVDLVKRAVPLALTPEDDPMRDELKRLQEKKEEIDVLAHKQVQRILWCGLGLAVVQVTLFFRLTFWEFSWDVMEPIAFFGTATGIVVGYAYFLFTARDPTYQDLMKRLFLSRQRKLFKKLNFDVQRFKELQNKCKTPLDATASIKSRVGVELELEDAIRKD